MFKNFRDKIALSGVAVLGIGVALLVFTFISAYGFLTQNLSIIASEDLMQMFGGALAPLIAACIHIMYLGVMGWIGSLITIRGVTIIVNIPKVEAVAMQKPAAPQPKPLPQNAKTAPAKEAKPEAKPQEPQIVVIPPEEVAQPQTQPQNEQQKSDSQQQQT
jgi:predicted lipid-binding transport protein (Tim44 family)